MKNSRANGQSRARSPRLFLVIAIGFARCLTAADVELQLLTGEELRQTLGSTELELRHAAAVGKDGGWPTGTLSCNKDVRLVGNLLPVGEYQIVIEPMREGHVHVVLKSEQAEVLRLAVATKPNEGVAPAAIGLRVEEPRNTRRRRRPREPSVELNISRGAQQISLPLQLTGVVWRATPEPAMPAKLKKPWSVVKSSLMGFVNQSMDQHVEHFAKDFESDWDDGGSQEAHMQMVGRMLFEGEFEDTVLQLDQLEWSQDGEKIIFRGIVVLAPLGPTSLVYTVAPSDQGWEIVHLDGPKL